MNEKAIKKLRHKFILIAFISFMLVMATMSITIFTANLISTTRQVYNTLNFLAEGGSEQVVLFNDFSTEDEAPPDDGSFLSGFYNAMQDMFNTNAKSNEEIMFSLRYFAVVFKEGEEPEVFHLFEMNEEEAVHRAQLVLAENREFGVEDNLAHIIKTKKDTTVVLFMNVETERANVRRVGNIALFLTVFSSILAFVIIRIFSNFAIRPEIRNAENQKKFITNASHELKTPLAVIRANTELEMMMHGEDEWNRSTMNQVDRMTGLIQNLVMIARADEKANKEDMAETDVSKVVSDTADTFLPVATQSGKSMRKEISEGVTMLTNEAHIRQLVSLLVDNAIKYCDDGGEIGVLLSQKGKGVRIEISNSYAEGGSQDYSRFFDRFYRQDESHNIDKGGYGIGLSIADSLVRRYKGKIDVSWKDGVISFVCVLKGA